jgi:hypothetical protein
MATATGTAAKKAKHGEKMIEVKIRFWTDEIAGERNKIIPKHAWSSGVVRIERNEAHDISPAAGIPFNSLLDLGIAVEKTLLAHGIVLHPSRKMRKYFRAKP